MRGWRIRRASATASSPAAALQGGRGPVLLVGAPGRPGADRGAVAVPGGQLGLTPQFGQRVADLGVVDVGKLAAGADRLGGSTYRITCRSRVVRAEVSVLVAASRCGRDTRRHRRTGANASTSCTTCVSRASGSRPRRIRSRSTPPTTRRWPNSRRAAGAVRAHGAGIHVRTRCARPRGRPGQGQAAGPAGRHGSGTCPDGSRRTPGRIRGRCRCPARCRRPRSPGRAITKVTWCSASDQGRSGSGC